MPTIRAGAYLRNGYNEISTFCHQHGEPVFITKTGKVIQSLIEVHSPRDIESVRFKASADDPFRQWSLQRSS